MLRFRGLLKNLRSGVNPRFFMPWYNSGEVWTQKKGKLDISHRYNRIPLLPSGPGGVLQELVVYDLPGHKGKKIYLFAKRKLSLGSIRIIFWASS